MKPIDSNTPDFEDPQSGSRDSLWLLIAAGALLIFSIVAIVKEHRTEWRAIQSEARQMIFEKFGSEAAAAVPAGIQQIWIPELENRVDRCITCHVGIEWEGLEKAPQPFTTHPFPKLMAEHPLAKYGCTSCHRGQGYALEKEAAHGYVIPEEWPLMMLGEKVRKEYGLKNKYGAVEITCNNCHRYEEKTPGVMLIGRAKEVVDNKGCRGCHIIEGDGGSFGPKLDGMGGHAGEHFNFARLKDKKLSIMTWHERHFENPQKVSATSFMTQMKYSQEDIQGLSLLMLSWTEDDVPRHYLATPPPRGR